MAVDNGINFLQNTLGVYMAYGSMSIHSLVMVFCARALLTIPLTRYCNFI
jgi:hypothetical protein